MNSPEEPCTILSPAKRATPGTLGARTRPQQPSPQKHSENVEDKTNTHSAGKTGTEKNKKKAPKQKKSKQKQIKNPGKDQPSILEFMTRSQEPSTSGKCHPEEPLSFKIMLNKDNPVVERESGGLYSGEGTLEPKTIRDKNNSRNKTLGGGQDEQDKLMQAPEPDHVV